MRWIEPNSSVRRVRSESLDSAKVQPRSLTSRAIPLRRELVLCRNRNVAICIRLLPSSMSVLLSDVPFVEPTN